MSTITTVVIVVVAVIAIAALAGLAAVLVRERRRSIALRQRFGPEYERAMAQHGSRREAEEELQGRTERRGALHIRELDAGSREAFARRWHEIQARFVDAPADAVADADRLVAEVMYRRGYPVDDFEHRADDVSVDHPDVTGDYRAAHEIAAASGRGEAGTEDYRAAMVRFRSLFGELLGGEPVPERERPAPPPTREL